MAGIKTKQTTESVTKFLNSVEDEGKRKDCFNIVEIMREATGFEPKMWGSSIVGFGSYHYKYESGHEGDAPLTGLASRSNAIVLYLSSNFDQREELLAKFGKHTTGSGCVYIKKLEDVDKDVLLKMVENTIAERKKQHT